MRRQKVSSEKTERPAMAGRPDRTGRTEVECFMEVYFGTNFWDDRKTGAPLAKIPVHGSAEGDMLAWENKKVRIPAVYVGQEGAVLDLCICVPLPDISEYMEKWKDRGYQDLSDEELEQAENESPFGGHFDVLLSMDGARLKGTFGCGTVWNPLLPDGDMDPETETLMEAYGCSREYGWVFHRNCFEWDGTPVLKPGKLECVLVPRKQSVTAAHFVTDISDGTGNVSDDMGDGKKQERKIQLVHPLSGATYTLTILSCEAGKYEGDWGDPGEELEYPSCYQEITYTVEPDIPTEELTIQDCARGDQPRGKGAGDKYTGTSLLTSSAALVPVYTAEEGRGAEERFAWSSLNFEPVDRTEWRAVFHIKKERNLHMQADLASLNLQYRTERHGGRYGEK